MRTLATVFLIATASIAFAQKATKDTAKKVDSKDPFQSSTFSGLKFRSIGPAITSGRIVDLAVNPKNTLEYYVASASGGVWKTVNAGVTPALVRVRQVLGTSRQGSCPRQVFVTSRHGS